MSCIIRSMISKVVSSAECFSKPVLAIVIYIVGLEIFMHLMKHGSFKYFCNCWKDRNWLVIVEYKGEITTTPAFVPAQARID